MHRGRLRTSAKGRIFGPRTRCGVRVSRARLRTRDGSTLLERAGLPAVGRHSTGECLAPLDVLDARLGPLDAEPRPFANAHPRALRLDTIPGLGEPLALTIALELGEIGRFARPQKLVPHARLAPRVRQARPRSGPPSTSGPRPLACAPLEAAQHAGREPNPRHQLDLDLAHRTPNTNPATAAVAGKTLTATRHTRPRNEPLKPAPRSTTGSPVPASPRFAFAA